MNKIIIRLDDLPPETNYIAQDTTQSGGDGKWYPYEIIPILAKAFSLWVYDSKDVHWQFNNRHLSVDVPLDFHDWGKSRLKVTDGCVEVDPQDCTIAPHATIAKNMG